MCTARTFDFRRRSPWREPTQAAGIDCRHVIDPDRLNLVELGIQDLPGVASAARAP